MLELKKMIEENNFETTKSFSEEGIKTMERILNLNLSQDYITIALNYGGISNENIEIYNPTKMVKDTIEFRKNFENFPKDTYVISNHKSKENIIYLQNEKGTVFEFDTKSDEGSHRIAKDILLFFDRIDATKEIKNENFMLNRTY